MDPSGSGCNDMAPLLCGWRPGCLRRLLDRKPPGGSGSWIRHHYQMRGRAHTPCQEQVFSTRARAQTAAAVGEPTAWLHGKSRAMATKPDATTGSLTIAGKYDAELRRHHERFMAAMRIGWTDRVLDVGCGAGQTTREAAHPGGVGQ